MKRFKRPKLSTVIGTVLLTAMFIAMPIVTVWFTQFPGQEPDWWLVWPIYGFEAFMVSGSSLIMYFGNRDYKQREKLMETITQRLTSPTAPIQATLILQAERVRVFTLNDDRAQCILLMNRERQFYWRATKGMADSLMTDIWSQVTDKRHKDKLAPAA